MPIYSYRETQSSVERKIKEFSMNTTLLKSSLLGFIASLPMIGNAICPNMASAQNFNRPDFQQRQYGGSSSFGSNCPGGNCYTPNNSQPQRRFGAFPQRRQPMFPSWASDGQQMRPSPYSNFGSSQPPVSPNNYGSNFGVSDFGSPCNR